MERLSIEQLEARASAFDRAVAETPDIDFFCSSSVWILAAYEGLMPPREAWIGASGAEWLVLARGRDPLYGTYLEPLESMWGFASPFVGSASGRWAAESIEALDADPTWRLLILSGLAPGGVWLRELATRRPSHWRLVPAARTARCRASLSGGLEGYLGRRTGNFRRNLWREQRRVGAKGIDLELWDGIADERAIPSLFDRVVDVERRSWKGRDRVGIDDGRMRAFYADMLPRLAAAGRLRGVFARRDGEDLAYHFGGVFGDTYRGLQQSYDARYRGLSIGAVTHAAMIRAICDEGLALYDLGQHVPYKTRWAESIFETVTIVAIR